MVHSGVEMAWESPRYDKALYWSPNDLVDASVEVLISFLVLICTILNLITSFSIRVTGFHIPCSCCSHVPRSELRSTVEATKYSFASPKFKSIATPVVSEVGLYEFHRSDDLFRDLELKKPADLTPSCEYEESSPARSSLDDFNDRSHEHVDREQYVKAQEILRALQSEREVMAALYSELEEERNSSATAASEALAMISRLQEEKAAVQMEARQFQRMVMEKAMYDQEAIEVLTEILGKREDERLALEEELELYKEKLESVLAEERDYAEIVGRDYAPLLLLERTPAEEKYISPKSERAELPVSRRITPNGRIPKDEKITPTGARDRTTPNGKTGKDERTTPNVKTGKDERITPNGRLAKEEEAEFLDRLNKTKSQLLTALLQERIPDSASTLDDSAAFANEIHKAMAKVPVRAESLPILEHECYKPSLGLATIKIGREIGLPVPPAFDKKQTEKGLTKDAKQAVDEHLFVSRKPNPPTIATKQMERAVTKDAGKTLDEHVLVSREPTPPPIPKKPIEKTNNAPKVSREPVLISQRNSLPALPAIIAKKQPCVGKIPGKADEPTVTSRETRLLDHPADVKKQNENSLVKDDSEAACEPLFASLKRRWSSCDFQETSVAESLPKAKEDRRIEEKRLSVLEYVRNLEEQLQQKAGRPTAQLSRARSVDGREDDSRSRSSVQFERSVSVKTESAGGGEREETVQRRLFAEVESVDKELNVTSLQGEGVGRIYSQERSFNAGSNGKASVDADEFYVDAGKLEENDDEALFVHDVYEV
ncbi:uncharacterized protein [Physcomitrium patens]|uniref:GTD-binding domain-containing protein n=1 Tax=Physcomitrium patens TaxID=3218 RepID=A0A2K1L1J0_PHYPA|nr:uncharacterized protein LOC112279093 [Physcomitrium patens]PNR59895.1 hypothetical protein PHYPA_002687 [Physcomitrium patens]|eukprot:XP_024368972.1 uncharacterized protein LOC112279093 [Physcomitrella patens]